MFKLAYDLYHGASTLDAVTASLRGTLHYYNSEARFHTAFDFTPDEPVDWYSWSGLKYFLYEYEKHLGRLVGDESVWLTWDEVEGAAREKTIEHVYPQTPDDPYWKKRFSDEDAGIYLNDLGNLCLTKDNSSYSNKSFDKKKGEPGQETPCYANAGLRQERELCQYAEWTPESIRDRHAKLASWALERWGLPAEPGEKPPEVLDEEEEEITEAALLSAS